WPCAAGSRASRTRRSPSTSSSRRPRPSCARSSGRRGSSDRASRRRGWRRGRWGPEVAHPQSAPARAASRRHARPPPSGSARRPGVAAPRPPGPRVGYLVSRFPKLSETFVLYEILAVEAEGLEVEIYPLQRERARTLHPEAEALVERAKFTPLL